MTSARWVLWDRLFALVLVMGGLFILWEGSHYSFGELARIGPGFMPTIIGAAIVLCGLAIMLRTRGEGVDLTLPSLRPLIFLPLAIGAFILLLERAGMIPATLALLLIATPADRSMTWKSIAQIVVAGLAIAVGVFHYGFDIPVPLLTWAF